MKHKPDRLLQFVDLRPVPKAQDTPMPRTLPDDYQVNSILNELRVHQLELEMQNNELRCTQEALEESLNRYVSLYEFAPVGYLTLKDNHSIAEANLTSAKLLMEDRATLLKQRFPRFISPEDSDRWHQHFRHVMQHEGNKSCEVRMKRTDGSLFHARLDCLLLDPENTIHSKPAPPMVRVALTDITEIKLAEQELRIAATVFNSQEGMLVTNERNVILKVNRAFTSITGYTATDAVGQTLHMLDSGRHDQEFYASMWARIHDTGEWQGEIWSRRRDGEAFPGWLTVTAVRNVVNTISHYVATLTDITARKAAEDEMQLLAFYDQLTQLPNRRLLLDRLHQAIATSARINRYCALMFIDLDDFKLLNDTFGHDIGDLMLQIVAQRLVICVREGDTVARIGGDEFVVMLENLNENQQEAITMAEVIGKKILSAISQPFQFADHEWFSTASIGVTLFTNHRHSIPELQKQADLAMYQAKTAGRNTLRFFKPELLLSENELDF